MTAHACIPTHEHWLQTFSGKALDLLNPYASDIDLLDIAVALSRVNRFGGHTRFPYSVAQHSLVVAAILESQNASPLIVLQGLLHDAPEAYIGDMPSPLKRLLPEYKAIEHRVWYAITLKFGLPFVLTREVKDADLLALNAEAHDLLPSGPLHNWAGDRPRLPEDVNALIVAPYGRGREHAGLASVFQVRVNALRQKVLEAAS